MGYHPVTLSFIRQDYRGMLAGSIVYDQTAISFEARYSIQLSYGRGLCKILRTAFDTSQCAPRSSVTVLQAT